MATLIADIIEQNTVGYSDGAPVGVPSSWAWASGVYKPVGYSAPPSGFTSVTGWASVYQKQGAPAYYNSNANVEVANAKTYVHLKTGQWVLVQDQATNPIAGGHFVADLSGNAGIPMKVTPLPGGGAALDAPPAGYNDHFWSAARGTYAAGSVDAVYVQMDMRVDDPNLHLIANVGADWWRTPTVGYVDGFSNNPGAGISNWVDLSTNWTTIGFYSSSTAQFQAAPPPPLLGFNGELPKPTIASFSSDTGIVGDGITSATTLKLSGKAQAGSAVSVFDGAAKVGTTTANAGGDWSLTTSKLTSAVHSFTAKATDAAGKMSQASAALTVTVDAIAPTPPRIMSYSPSTNSPNAGNASALAAAARPGTTNQLTLSGSAEAGSTVNVFDGTMKIGTAVVQSNGSWSFKTAALPDGAHNFKATATDRAGNTSSLSSGLTVNLGTGTTPLPVSDGQNLLVNGSFEAPALTALAGSGGSWGAFSSIPGWTAISGGTIELWRNLNNVKASDGINYGELDYLGARDGFYQDVKTLAGQSYDLSFDARSRPGFTGSTCSIEVLWNNSVVAVVPPGNTWETYDFTVIGTGGQDRLTIREVAGQGGDGLGGLYDNFALVVSKKTPLTTALSESYRAVDLMNQYSASSLVSAGPATSGVISREALANDGQTLTSPLQH